MPLDTNSASLATMGSLLDTLRNRPKPVRTLWSVHLCAEDPHWEQEVYFHDETRARAFANACVSCKDNNGVDYYTSIELIDLKGRWHTIFEAEEERRLMGDGE